MMPQSRFVKSCYDMMLNDDVNGRTNWATSIRLILQRNGFGIVWQNQMVASEPLFLKLFVNRLKDCFLQEWNTSINSNPKLDSYHMYKNEFSYEKYLEVLDIRKFRYIYVNFRVGAHELEIERGRYQNIPEEIGFVNYVK